MLTRRHVFCLIGALGCLPAWSTSVLPLSLEEIATTAAIVFEGRCVENRTEQEAPNNRIVTYTTFEIVDVIKGRSQLSGTTHVIKQIGGSPPGAEITYKVRGVPTFTVGESYVVFLAGVSRLGFSSPIGLSQGQFAIVKGPNGAEATNGRDFKAMTAAVPAQKLPPGAQRAIQAPGAVRHMDLTSFKQLARQLAGGAQ